jgi:hypothetical protein
LKVAFVFLWKQDIWDNANNVARKWVLTIKVECQPFVLMNVAINGSGIILDKGKNLMNTYARIAAKWS